MEAGQGIGVQREVLCSFFEDFYGSCCTGASELVPIVRHDMTQLQWEAVARIIIYAIKHGYFPVRLSPAFLKASFLGDIISKEELISSFKNYISIEEKDIVEENMKELSDDTSDLLDVLSAFKCYSRPTKDNLEQIIHQLAHQELIQKPKYISSCFFSIFKAVVFPVVFPAGFSPVNLKQFFEKKIPSGRKVSALFNATPTDPEEIQSFDHLKRYVKNLNIVDLTKLLRVMTGSDIIVVEKIDIVFTSLIGFNRRPIFHTCSPSLELPKTYGSYNELSEEFNSIINNPKGSLSFDIA